MNYAEIKALATGNPLIKEKMELDTEVTKLKMLEANYRSNKYKLEDRINKYYPKTIAETSAILEKNKLDLSRLEKKKGDNFIGITLKDEKIYDKKIAGEKLLSILKSFKPGKEMVIGQYRNFDIQVSNNVFTNEYSFTLIGQTKHEGSFGLSPDGNLARIDNVLEKIPERIEKLENKLNQTKDQLATAKIELEKPFERAEELREKVLRLAEINQMLDMDLNIEVEKIAIQSDYEFVLIGQEEVEEINLYETKTKVQVDGREYKLYQGVTFNDEDMICEVFNRTPGRDIKLVSEFELKDTTKEIVQEDREL